jgi:hypothetical protein
MNKHTWLAIAFMSCLGCADDGGARRADVAADAGTDASADASADAGMPPLGDAVREEISFYDRRIRATCPCLVAQGEYQTEEDCLKLGLSGPDWVDCATKALAAYDNPTTRSQSKCYFDFLRDAAECVEMSNCATDKLALCGDPDLNCLAENNERLTLLLTACPDFGLLSRVSQ